MLQILIEKTLVLMAPYQNLSLFKKGQIQKEAGPHLEHVLLLLQKQGTTTESFVYLLLDKLL